MRDSTYRRRSPNNGPINTEPAELIGSELPTEPLLLPLAYGDKTHLAAWMI
jgi:hypothetical protein